jgi:hypothetical protein
MLGNAIDQMKDLPYKCVGIRLAKLNQVYGQ